MRKLKEKVSIFLRKRKKICSTKIEGKDNNREGMKNQGEDNNIYCWSVQSVRHSFQSSGHDFQVFFSFSWARILRSIQSARMEQSVQWHRNRGRKEKKYLSLIFPICHGKRGRDFLF